MGEVTGNISKKKEWGKYPEYAPDVGIGASRLQNGAVTWPKLHETVQDKIGEKVDEKNGVFKNTPKLLTGEIAVTLKNTQLSVGEKKDDVPGEGFSLPYVYDTDLTADVFGVLYQVHIHIAEDMACSYAATGTDAYDFMSVCVDFDFKTGAVLKDMVYGMNPEEADIVTPAGIARFLLIDFINAGEGSALTLHRMDATEGFPQAEESCYLATRLDLAAALEEIKAETDEMKAEVEESISSHQENPVLDHPDGCVTYNKLTEYAKHQIENQDFTVIEDCNAIWEYELMLSDPPSVQSPYYLNTAQIKWCGKDTQNMPIAKNGLLLSWFKEKKTISDNQEGEDGEVTVGPQIPVRVYEELWALPDFSNLYKREKIIAFSSGYPASASFHSATEWVRLQDREAILNSTLQYKMFDYKSAQFHTSYKPGMYTYTNEPEGIEGLPIYNLPYDENIPTKITIIHGGNESGVSCGTIGLGNNGRLWTLVSDSGEPANYQWKEFVSKADYDALEARIAALEGGA